MCVGDGADDGTNLPSYTETDPDGTAIVYHGTGEIDIETTAELAARDDPDEDDRPAEKPPPGQGARGAPATPPRGPRPRVCPWARR
ncbi:hypothetical protein ACFV1U_37460, partial [Streptomyces microflavus]